MLRRLLPIMMLALMSIASASEAVSAEEASPTRFGVLACGMTGQGFGVDVASCALRRRMLTFGDWEFSLGVEGLVSFEPTRAGHLSVLVGLDYYAERWGAFAELALPSLVPPSLPARWRLGFTMGF